MEVDYAKKDVQSVRDFLEEIGEDPNEYTEKQLVHMLEEGF